MSRQSVSGWVRTGDVRSWQCASYRQVLAAGFVLSAPGVLAAQQQSAASSSPPRPNRPERIDFAEQVRTVVAQSELEPCAPSDDATAISGEIVVCRRRDPDETAAAGFDKRAWEKRYAQESAYRGDPQAPDFILDCFDQGMPFGCVALGETPPPALLIDVEALPPAPPGSDADRIARGLPPLGRD